MEIAETLLQKQDNSYHPYQKRMYWLDFGNTKNAGQVILGTFGIIPQPRSKKYIPTGKLPCVTECFDLMKIDEKDIDERAMVHVEAIIQAMTPRERENPNILNASRKRRIATGSGRNIQEVNRLLKQFEEMKKMMKQFTDMGKSGKKRGKQAFGGLPFMK